jgi:hypothetical protein
MNQNEIIDMARQATAIPMHKDFNQLVLIGNENIEAFAKLVAEAAASKEREAVVDLVAFYGGSVDFEAAIRARGEA